MSERINKLLTNGLLEGYAGVKKPEHIKRSEFEGKTNDYVNLQGGRYHDEWFANENGGGQELVKEGDEQFTRLYGGGVIPVEELKKLDITTKNIISRLRLSIGELKEKTRLYEPASLSLPDGWEYKYIILKKSEEVPLTIGYESIEYKGKEVFAHGHILSSIK